MQVESLVKEVTGASGVWRKERLQALWSGYGEIVRLRVEGAGDAMHSVVVKHVAPPDDDVHPRGWNTDLSRERKLRSYEIELVFYERYASRCGTACRVAKLLGSRRIKGGWLMVLEDLDAAGFSEREAAGIDEGRLCSCLAWLAAFHARFLGEVSTEGLWETGTYWHLATRPDELAAMPAGPLKLAAGEIDRRLSGGRFKTLVHGDAKVANFCFADSGEVAAVDFQYVGGGCGMKDLAYFLSSYLSEDACERREAELLDLYFETLAGEVTRLGKTCDVAAVEAEWRELYPLAWADFHRFLLGWSPGHWKLNGSSESVVRSVLAKL